MSLLTNKRVLFLDHGLNLYMAECLAKECAELIYFVPWIEPFPNLNKARIGSGIPGIRRVDDYEPYLDKCDLIVCPDNYFGEFAVDQRKQGRLVWGAGRSERLELDRWYARQLQDKLGLPTPATEEIIGTEDLLKFLQDPANDGKFIKISKYRGLFETFEHINWFCTKLIIEEKIAKLGPFQEEQVFLAEEKIPGQEIGVDTYNVRGQWPERVMLGIEEKDCGFVGRVLPYHQMPQQTQDVTDKLSGFFEEYDASTFVSLEVRIADEDRAGYLVDPTVRAPIPPGPAYGLLYKNLPDIIYQGAQGIMEQPDIAGEFVVIARIHCQHAAKGWTAVEYPEEYSENIHLSSYCVIDGGKYVIPQAHESIEIGDVVVVGDDVEECEEQIQEITKSIKGHDIDVQVRAVEEAEKTIEKAEKLGIEFWGKAVA